MQRYYRLTLLILGLVIAALLINLPIGKPIHFYMPLKEGLDLAGGTRVILKAKPEVWRTVKPNERDDKMRAVVDTIQKRVQGFSGVSEPLIQRQGQDRIIVELPGIKDPEKAIQALRSTAELQFYYLKDVKTDRNPYGKWSIPSSLEQDENGNDVYSFIGPNGEEVKDPKEIMEKVVDVKDNPKALILTGARLKPNASADINPGNKPVINIQFDDKGTEEFRNFTRTHVGEILAIFFDGKILTAPVIKDAIPNGRAEISGFKDIAEAQQKAEFLNAGALPIPLDIEGQDSVEASLGHETVNQSILAGLVGLGLVILFMLLYYRLPGLLADVALALYALFSLAMFRLLHVTMTLPGLAGFILSIGMAVDANILIFERLKEELKSGKTLRASIEAGFGRAFTAIFDSNMCTAITCAILMWFGTGSVKSFAFVLLLGVLISMFTAITVTRTILFLLVNWQWAQKPSLFGLSTSWFAKTGRQLNVVGKRNWYFALSLAVIIPGMYFLVTSGLKPGIEFTSGSALQVTFNSSVTAPEVSQTVKSVGVDNLVQISKDNKTAFIRMKDVKQAKINQVRDALRSDIGSYSKENLSFVGPTISKELVSKAILSLLVAMGLIVVYLSGRFAVGGFKNGLKFGVCAIIATFHDVLVITGIFAILGHFLGWEVDSLFVTAVLTIVGFSTHDTIVVFDRIRENLKHRQRGEDFESLANRSILQTFARSINTSLTVLITLGALIALGGPIIKEFYIAMFIGVISGTYSSIFNATPLVVVWEQIATRGQGVPAKKREERAMVDTSMVEQLKPIDEATGYFPQEDASSQAGAPAPSRAAGSKVTPKKKKRRY